eukprot:scaffold1769_cov277-Prasinococcus_capsulatus_cf.AAC.5
MELTLTTLSRRGAAALPRSSPVNTYGASTFTAKVSSWPSRDWRGRVSKTPAAKRTNERTNERTNA